MELLHNFWSHPANCSNSQNRTYHHQIFIYTQQAEELQKDNNLTNFCNHHPCKARLSWHWRDNVWLNQFLRDIVWGCYDHLIMQRWYLRSCIDDWTMTAHQQGVPANVFLDRCRSPVSNMHAETPKSPSFTTPFPSTKIFPACQDFQVGFECKDHACVGTQIHGMCKNVSKATSR